MATLNGSNGRACALEGFGGSVTPLYYALVMFDLSGTYVQADNAQLQSVHTIIQNSRRDGKTVALKTVACGHPARKLSDPSLMMGLKTLAISTNDITFEVTESATANAVDLSTELAAGAVPAQQTPFQILVGFTLS